MFGDFISDPVGFVLRDTHIFMGSLVRCLHHSVARGRGGQTQGVKNSSLTVE